MAIAGTIQLTGQIAPTDVTDTYALTDPLFSIDGLRSVADHTERDVISTARRREGMLVYTRNDSKYWKLASDLTSWTQFSIATNTDDIAALNPVTVVNDTDFLHVLQSSTDRKAGRLEICSGEHLVFNIRAKPYSAVGDGVANDATAISAALSDAGATDRGAIVYVPPGYYKITSGITIPQKVSLIGAGPFASCIYFNQTTGFGVTFGDANLIGSTPVTSYGSVENLCFEGQSSTNSATALRVVKCIQGLFRNLQFRVIGTALEFTGSFSPNQEWTGLHVVQHLNTTNVTTGVFFNGWVTDTTITGAELNGKGGTQGTRIGTGFKMTDRTATCHFFGVNVEGFGTGYDINTIGGSGSEFISCREENNDTPLIWGTSSQNYLFVGGNGAFADPDGNNFWNGTTTHRGSICVIPRDNPFPILTTLPTAGASDRWRTVRFPGGLGIKDTLKVCLKQADGTYAWETIV